ncbi:MAG: phosphatidate cytidylyltransferase [Gammaproteobacteria bacterium]
MSRYAGLRERALTAIVLAAALLLVLFALPASFTTLLVALVVLSGAWEWSAFLRLSQPLWRYAYLLLVGLGYLVAWQSTQTPGALSLLMGVAAIWWLVALAWVMFAPTREGRLVTAIAGLCVIVPAGVALQRLRFEENGAWLLLFALVIVMAADIGAYFAGNRFGRLRLAPKVSPGKSWEGVIGGVIASLVVAAIGAYFLVWPLTAVLLTGAAAAAFSVVGDLTESLMKRHSGLKDSGGLLPGHGGVLDRFDSLSAGVPIFVLGLLEAGLIGGAA